MTCVLSWFDNSKWKKEGRGKRIEWRRKLKTQVWKIQWPMMRESWRERDKKREWKREREGARGMDGERKCKQIQNSKRSFENSQFLNTNFWDFPFRGDLTRKEISLCSWVNSKCPNRTRNRCLLSFDENNGTKQRTAYYKYISNTEHKDNAFIINFQGSVNKS